MLIDIDIEEFRFRSDRARTCPAYFGYTESIIDLVEFRIGVARLRNTDPDDLNISDDDIHDPAPSPTVDNHPDPRARTCTCGNPRPHIHNLYGDDPCVNVCRVDR